MRSASVILGSSLLAIALIAAPALADLERGELACVSNAENCCGCCRESISQDQQSCCLREADGQPASSKPCEQDGGRCPCCPAAATVVVAILDQSGDVLDRPLSDQIILADDLVSSRCDEPLLPPPRN